MRSAAARTIRAGVALGLYLSPYLRDVQAQPLESVPALSAQAIRAHAEFLSSDLLEGRATGSRGYELAAAYVAAQFRQSGLLPIIDNKGDSKSELGYLQPVPLIEATVVLPGSSASLRRDGATINFEFSKDYLPSANFFNASASLSAPLVFAGYGIDAPELKYNDFTDLELQGRIAIILNGAPERFNTDARNYYGWRETKYANLVKQGALGVIEVDTRDRKDDDAPSHWERATAMSWVSELRRVSDEDQPAERFPELKLKFRFNLDAAAQLFPSNRPLDQIIQAAKSDSQSSALPGMVNLSATTGLRRIESNNVLGVIRGSDPRLQNEYVLVVANLDQLGRGAAVNGDNIYNGLQRNAVGVAMLMDMARGIAALPVRPKRSILFAAVTAGEKGAQGLQYLLSDGPVTARNIVAGIALDMPLPVTRTSDVIAVGVDQSSIGTLLVNAAQQQNLRVARADEPPFSLLSDTLTPLIRASIPVLSLHGGLRARDGRSDVRGTRREWLQAHIDQPSDDQRNMPLDIAATRELATLNAATVVQLANIAERPVWYRSSLVHRKLAE
ncbi:MAG: M28 family peptidase [Steroidobacteraceae bacterium]